MKSLFFIFGLLLAFAACSDDNNTPVSPIDDLVMPSVSTPFLTGESVTIQGKGFDSGSQIWLRGIVSKTTGDIQAPVKEVTENSITFTVPKEIDGEQAVILKQNGEEFSLGKLTFKTAPVEKKLYAFKRIFNNQTPIYQIININLTTGEEKIIVSSLPITSTYFEYLVFNSSAREIIGLDGNKLLKVNVENGNITDLNLPLGDSEDYAGLALDNSNNLYAFKRIYKDQVRNYQIVNVDLTTGKEKIIASSLPITSTYFKYLVFNSSTKEIIGLDKVKLLKVNVEDGRCSNLNLSLGDSEDYKGLVLDDYNNLYAFKRIYKDQLDTYQIVNVDLTTGKEKIIAPSLPITLTYFEYLVFDSSAREIIGLDGNKLLKVNIENGTYSDLNLNIGDLEDISGLVLE